MPTKKQIQPGETVPLKLTATERKLVLEDLMCLDEDYEQIIRETPTGKPVMMTLDELDDFGGYIAAEANHCDDKKKEKKLDTVFEKIQSVMDRYTDEEPPQTLNIEDARKEKVISDQAMQIAEFAAKALVAAEQLRIKTKPLDNFWLAPGQRDVLLLVPGVSKSIKKQTGEGQCVLHRVRSRQHDDGPGRRFAGWRGTEADRRASSRQAPDGSPPRGNHGEG